MTKSINAASIGRQIGRRGRYLGTLLLPLEPRLMFDGAAVADAAHAAADASAKALIPAVAAPVVVRDADPSKDGGKKEVAFVDTSVADYKAIEAGIRDGIAIVEIGGGADGLAQMAAWAEANTGYDAIHVFSHGSEGAVALGSATLNAASLSEAATQAELAEIGHALKAGGDLLLYGCDVAIGVDGRSLLASISVATGADVAASDDTTGAASKGGDWALEASTGSIDVATISVEGYGGVLAAPADQDFESASTINEGGAGATLTVNGITFTATGTDPWVALTTISGYVDNTFTAGGVTLSGQGIAADYNGSNDGSHLVTSLSMSYGDVFKLVKMAVGLQKTVGIPTVSFATIIDIAGYTGATKVTEVTGIDLSATGITYTASTGGTLADITYTRSVDGTGGVGYGGALSFGSEWDGVDKVVFSVNSTQAGRNLVIVLDGIDFEAATPRPTFTSGTSASIAENTATSTTVYTAAATASSGGGTVNYALGGTDAASFDLTNGALTFKASPNYEVKSSYSVTITATDSNGSRSQAVTVNVTNVNEAPSFTSGTTASFAENGTGTVYTATSSDPDSGATASYSIVGGADQAKFNINSGTGALTFVSAPNYESPTDSDTNNTYVVTLRVSDGTNTTDQTVTVTVTDVNEAPSFTSGTTANFAENGTGTAYTATSSDPDSGATASYSIVGGADQAKFNINSGTGVLTFVLAPDRENPTDTDTNNTYVVTLRVFDGTNTTDQTVTVTVTDANDTAPVVTSNGGGATAAINVAENSTAVTTVAATDADTTGSVSYSISGGADQALFTINASTGVLAFVSGRNRESPSDADTNNTYVVVVAASDGTQTSTQTITVTITDVNEFSPTITSNGGGATALVSIIENSTAVTTVVGADSDSSASLTYSLVGGADQAKFSINSSTGALIFASAPDYETPLDTGDTAGNNTYVVQVQVSDGTNTVTQTLTVTVTDTANENAPVITSNGGGATASINVAENSTAVTTVTATDADPAPTLTYSVVGGADQSKFSINSSSGALTFTSGRDRENPTDADTNNTYVVQVQVSDGLNTATQTITVTVTDANDTAPVITSNGGGATAAINVAENSTAVTTVTATDADTTGSVSYSISGGADQALFTINSSTGVLAFASGCNRESPSDADTNNTYVVTVTANDGTQSANQTITVTITDVNEFTPAITSNGGGGGAAITINENSTAVTTVTASDGDSSASLTYSIVGGADQAKFNINATTGVLTLATAPDFENPSDGGTDNTYVVQVRASDGTNTVDQTITVTVADVTGTTPTITAPSSTTSTTVTVTGTADANTTVSIYDRAVLLGTVTADGSGAWDYAAKLIVGSHTLIAKTTVDGTTFTSAATSVTVNSSSNNSADGGVAGGNETGGGDTSGGNVKTDGEKSSDSLKTIVRSDDKGTKGFGLDSGTGLGAGAGMGTGAGLGGGAGMGFGGDGGRVAIIPAVLTPGVAGAFQVAVAAKPAGGGDALVVNAPMRDTAIAIGSSLNVTIPAEAFAHTKADATVTLVASQINGAALPSWMVFDAKTGTFKGTPPPGFRGEVTVKVVARDNEGREAVQTFKIQVGGAGQGNVAPGEGGPGEGGPGGPRSGDIGLPGKLAQAVGRPSLTEQLRNLSRDGQKAGGKALIALLQGKGRAA